MKNNLETWNKFKQPPLTALKAIKAGRLKGMHNISPQWRYQAMTEVFGMIGFGWKYTIEKRWTSEVSNGEQLCFVEILLYVKVGEEWSAGIPGSGGSKLIAKESAGMHNNDEAVKMAETDALGTAMAKLGVGADIYLGTFDGSKYAEPTEFPKQINTTAQAKRAVENTAAVTDEGNVDEDFPQKSDAKVYEINGKGYSAELMKELRTLTQLPNVEIVQALNAMEHGSYTAEQISIQIKSQGE